MRYAAIRRHRDQYPLQLMCRCLKVSRSGYHAWSGRLASARARDNQRLLERIRQIHTESDGVIGMPRMHERLAFEGERASPNRVALLLASAELYGVPQRRRWRHKRVGVRPSHVRNHLERDFAANEPNTKWCHRHHLHPHRRRLAVPVRRARSVQQEGRRLGDGYPQDRNLVLRAVLMALWQGGDRSQAVVLHSDHSTQFTCEEYQQFLTGHNLVRSMSAVDHCGDNAAAEGFFGMIKRERVNRRHFRTTTEAVSDVFDYIECFHNPRMQQRLDAEDQKFLALAQLSVKTG